MRSVKQLLCGVAVVIGLGAVGSGERLRAAEFGANTPYYEDDGWLDITEWFDGNDYNPTDEAWWRWDDETYQSSKDTSGDQDSDGWYGYTNRDDNDWYYDYYDPTPYTYYDNDNNGLYDYGSRYYDYDNDGIYDAFASYSDWDGDGFYEDYDYYSFTDSGTSQQRAQAQKQVARESRQQTVSGKVQQTKLVNVRGGKQHVVVAIQPQQQQQDQKGQPVIADLGRAEDLKDLNPKVGNQITVKGPKAQVGKQTVILAKSIESGGQTKQVNRDARSITGKVLSTHKAKVRGKEHLMAMVETKQKEKTHKIAVDLGPADKLRADISKGSSVTISGFPVKVKDKSLIMARWIKQGEQFVQIDRQPSNAGDQAQPASAGDKDQSKKEKSSQ